jgi:DNA-directed RNA polymerase sigma subunit (sigma70/sigma32)
MIADQATFVAAYVARCGHRHRDPQRDAAIFWARRDGATLRNVAERHGLSQSRVRQIIARIQRILRHPKHRGGLGDAATA